MKKILLIDRGFRVHLNFNIHVTAAGLLLLIFITTFSFAQNPLVKQWDYRYGGTGSDIFACFQQTADNGYILGGYSGSGISGDKTQAMWGYEDYWIIKVDSLGIKQWDSDFGGTGDDYFTSLQQTADGGYILGGRSSSVISGDKTQANWDVTNATYDYWIVKTDSLGNLQWDKRFGGTDEDWLTSLQQTTDGGYILGGISYSGISGNKSAPYWGNGDYWIVKIDSLGIKQWDKDFGTTVGDGLLSLQQTTDGGYILGGNSYSGISGDKTQDTWGADDYWIVKIDSLGTKQWDKDLGGTNNDFFHSLKQTFDGGYILGGISYSGIGGDKTQAIWGGYLDNDYWIVKTDSLGNKEWDKDFGGTNDEDAFGNISQTTDGGYLIAGTSYSNISGDKAENNLGPEQTWVVKTDMLGNKKWDKTLSTNSIYNDKNGLAIQTTDGCYAMANFTDAGIGGDKTQTNWGVYGGNYDYWLIKFCDTTSALLFISGDIQICEKFCTNFYDQSTNNPTSWQWNFPGGYPSSSTLQNPINICYNSPGTYDVTLITTNTNGNDTLTLPNYITVYSTPATPTITQVGYTLTSSTASSYQWQLNSVDIPGETNQSYIVLQSGLYTMVIGDANDCKNSVSQYVLISGIAEMNDANISIYPNPSSGNLSVELANGLIGDEVSIEVVSILGQNVFSSQEKIDALNWKKEIDLNGVARGVYFVEIKTKIDMLRQKILISQ